MILSLMLVICLERDLSSPLVVLVRRRPTWIAPDKRALIFKTFAYCKFEFGRRPVGLSSGCEVYHLADLHGRLALPVYLADNSAHFLAAYSQYVTTLSCVRDNKGATFTQTRGQMAYGKTLVSSDTAKLVRNAHK
jgi:hypothetical protein